MLAFLAVHLHRTSRTVEYDVAMLLIVIVIKLRSVVCVNDIARYRSLVVKRISVVRFFLIYRYRSVDIFLGINLRLVYRFIAQRVHQNMIDGVGILLGRNIYRGVLIRGVVLFYPILTVCNVRIVGLQSALRYVRHRTDSFLLCFRIVCLHFRHIVL